MRQTLSRAKLFYYKNVRYPLHKMSGYKVVNRYCKHWGVYPHQEMSSTVDEILRSIQVERFNKVLEVGCGDGTHYSEMVKQYCDTLYGMDIIEHGEVRGAVDKYIQVPLTLQESYLDDIKNDELDCVLILSFIGLNPQRDWREYLNGDTGSRHGRYFTDANFLRVLKPGGYIIIAEWEAFPEKRVGKQSFEAIKKEVDTYYPYHEKYQSLSFVTQGVSEKYMPYIVYHKES